MERDFDDDAVVLLTPQAVTHDNRYSHRPKSIERKGRPDTWAVDLIKNRGLAPETAALLIVLLDLPPYFEINIRYIVNKLNFGRETRVRRLVREALEAGFMQERRLRKPDGTWARGIYQISDEPRWLRKPVDISDRSDDAQAAAKAEGKATDPHVENLGVGIDNSIVNPDTDTGLDDVEKPVCQPLQADGRDRGRKSHLTGKAERRAGGAKASLPQTEPRNGAAKGSAMKGLASGEGDRTSDDRYTERLVDQMILAASMPQSRMPNPRKAARSIASLIQWRAEGYDFDLDVLPAIADVCSRGSDPDKQIVSWHYFTGAIRDRHASRTRQAERPRPARRQLEGWTPAATAYSGGRRQ